MSTIASQEAVQALRAQVRGEVLTPENVGFEQATRLWNGMIEKTPGLVLRPTGAVDVIAAVNFARERGLLLSVRGGGHNIAGTALTDGGLTLDMSSLRGVFVDPKARAVTVGAGCLLGDVDRETQLHGLATPLGFISEVGVAGLTLGGGLGYLTRRFGGPSITCSRSRSSSPTVACGKPAARSTRTSSGRSAAPARISGS